MSLTFLQHEEEVQWTLKMVRGIRTDHLRLARAHLLDVHQGGLSAYTEIALVRGRVVHEELENRGRNQSSSPHQTDLTKLDLLCRFPDLRPPPGMERPQQYPMLRAKPPSMAYASGFWIVAIVFATLIFIAMTAIFH